MDDKILMKFKEISERLPFTARNGLEIIKIDLIDEEGDPKFVLSFQGGRTTKINAMILLELEAIAESQEKTSKNSNSHMPNNPFTPATPYLQRAMEKSLKKRLKKDTSSESN